MNYYWPIFIQAIGILMSILLTVILTNIMSVNEYGGFVSVLAVATVLAIPALSGMPNLIIRYASKYKVRNDPACLNGLIIFSMGVAGCSVLIIILFNYINSEYLKLFNAKNSLEIVEISVLLVLFALVNSVSRSLGNNMLAQIFESILKNAVILLCIGVSYLIAKSLETTASSRSTFEIDLDLTLLAYTLGLLIITAISSAISIQTVYKKRHKPGYEFKSWFGALMKLSMSSSAQIIFSKLSFLYLIYLNKLGDVGLFNVALQIANLSLLAQAATANHLKPKIARLLAKNDLLQISTLLRNNIRKSIIWFFIVALLAVPSGYLLIEIVYGPDFKQSYFALIPLLVSFYFMASTGPVDALLKMSGNEKVVTTGLLFASFVMLLLMIIIGNWLPGFLTASIAYGVSIIIYKYFLARELRSILGIKISLIGLTKYGK